MSEAGTLYVEARGNNLTGLRRTAVVFDSEQLELRLLEPPSQEADLAKAIADFLRRNPGATTTVVTAGVPGRDAAIKRVLATDERFVSVPRVLFGKPRNSTCWARAEDAPGLLDATPAQNRADVGPTLARETDDNPGPATSRHEVSEGRAEVGCRPRPDSGPGLADDAAESGGKEDDE